MAQSAWPFGDQSVTDEQFRRWAREFAGSRVCSGLSVSANSTGMTVQVASGTAIVQGCAFLNSSSQAVTIQPNAASQPRVDTVVARLDYTLSPQIQLVVVQGVPNANPSAPALSQTDVGIFDLPLADVRVPAAAVTIAGTQVTNRLRGAYRQSGGAVKLWDADDVASLITNANPAFWAIDQVSARLSGGIVSINLRVHKIGADWATTSWAADSLLNLDAQIAGALDDVNLRSVNNNPSSDEFGFQLNRRSIKCRPWYEAGQSGGTTLIFHNGCWMDGSIQYSLA